MASEPLLLLKYGMILRATMALRIWTTLIKSSSCRRGRQSRNLWSNSIGNTMPPLASAARKLKRDHDAVSWDYDILID